MTAAIAGVVFALLTAAAALGGGLFAAAVLLWAVFALVVLAGAAAAAGHRPVLPASAVGGLGVPARLLMTPDAQMTAVPGIVAAMVLAAFLLAAARAGRRRVTAGVGVTCATGLIVGLGAGATVLLRDAQHGPRWALGLLLAIGVSEAAAAVIGRRRHEAQLPARVVVLGAVAGGLTAVADPPFGPLVALVALVVVLAAGLAAQLLQRTVGAGDALGGLGVRAATALGLAAPCVYLLSRAVQV